MRSVFCLNPWRTFLDLEQGEQDVLCQKFKRWEKKSWACSVRQQMWLNKADITRKIWCNFHTFSKSTEEPICSPLIGENGLEPQISIGTGRLPKLANEYFKQFNRTFRQMQVWCYLCKRQRILLLLTPVEVIYRWRIQFDRDCVSFPRFFKHTISWVKV